MNAPDIEPDMQRHIQARLDDVERSKGVRILFATESGSRAWGFPSPDSDWDVRFVYAHPTPGYLSLRERRDVIEAPLDARDVDLAGWDVRKALRLLFVPSLIYVLGLPPFLGWRLWRRMVSRAARSSGNRVRGAGTPRASAKRMSAVLSVAMRKFSTLGNSSVV